MKAITVVLLLFVSAQEILGFVRPVSVRSAASRPLSADQSTTDSIEFDGGYVGTPFEHPSSLAGIATGILGFVGKAIAEDEYEIAELPPVWVPAIFGVVLLIGVGVLTTSLGNVMDEEASLGMQSGARAKKEIERSRSSYFGKRPK